MRILVENDCNRGGWFLVYADALPLPFLTYYTGPFASRGDAVRAIPEYQKVIERALSESSATA